LFFGAGTKNQKKRGENRNENVEKTEQPHGQWPGDGDGVGKWFWRAPESGAGKSFGACKMHESLGATCEIYAHMLTAFKGQGDSRESSLSGSTYAAPRFFFLLGFQPKFWPRFFSSSR